MRLVTILALMAMAVLVFCPAALPKEKKKDAEDIFKNLPARLPPPGISVTVIQGGKRISGWGTDSGRIFVENSSGKIIMDGWINRTGAVTLYNSITDDNYVGQVNPMGSGLLMSPTTSDTLRIEVQR